MSQRCGELAREFFRRFWNERDTTAFDDLSDPESLAYQPDGTPMRAQEFREVQYEEFLKAIPDLQFEIEDVLDAGDQAVVRWFARGTHCGDGMGLQASGQEVGFRGMTWFTFRDGRIVNGWNCWDQGGLMHRLCQPAPVA